MQLGMVGLGRMGANMARRLLKGGHSLVVWNRSQGPVQELAREGATGTTDLADFARKLQPPRAGWVMLPQGDPTEAAIRELSELFSPGDVIIDGGNSFYKEAMRRAEMLKPKGIHFVDVGTSGGIWGLTEGYSMMVGGEAEVVERLRPLFETLAPAPDKGWGRVGPHGAGHFVKMVHNGIEYGMMQAYAEGFSIMKHKQELGLDLHQIAGVWQHGSVVRSWLLDLTKAALEEDQTLEDIAPYVPDTGEGRWTVFEAIDLNVAAPVITLSLQQRIRSRDEESFTDRLLAVMRQQFGGHAVKREE